MVPKKLPNGDVAANHLLLGKTSMTAAWDRDQPVRDARSLQSFVQAHGLAMGNPGILISMDRNDGRQPLSNILDRRNELRELPPVRVAAEPLDCPRLRIWTLQPLEHIRNAVLIDHRRHLEWRARTLPSRPVEEGSMAVVKARWLPAEAPVTTSRSASNPYSSACSITQRRAQRQSSTEAGARATRPRRYRRSQQPSPCRDTAAATGCWLPWCPGRGRHHENR